MNYSFESVATGLASAGYAVVDQFLRQDEVTAVLNTKGFQNSFGNFKKAGIGIALQRQVNEAIRSDYIQWIDKIDPPPPIKAYFAKINSLIEYLNRSLFLSLKDYEVHMTVYPPGACYKRHIDQHKLDDHRKLSIICYLNEGWKEEYGGQLRMHLPDAVLDILPLSGRLVCFRSDTIEHEVLPATEDRRSLTGWILDQMADLRHL